MHMVVIESHVLNDDKISCGLIRNSTKLPFR